jgi:hypothetical protein
MVAGSSVRGVANRLSLKVVGPFANARLWAIKNITIDKAQATANKVDPLTTNFIPLLCRN